MSEFKIFYSWQSDSPSKFNRSFIEDCIEKAIKKLKTEPFYDDSFVPVLDKDTRGLSGSPLIGKSVFHKIENANIFIADLTPVYETEKKWLSNPNVLIEFGFALKALGDSKLIYTMNLAGFSRESQDKFLPFDLRERRKPLFYNLGPSNLDQKASEKKKLTDFFFYCISEAYKNAPRNIDLNPTPLDSFSKTIEVKNQDLSQIPICIDDLEGDLYSHIRLNITFSNFTPKAQLNMIFNNDSYEMGYKTYNGDWNDGMPRQNIVLGFNGDNDYPYKLIIDIYPVSQELRVVKWRYDDSVIPPRDKPSQGSGEWQNTADELKSIQLFSNTKGAVATGELTYTIEYNRST